MHLDARRRRGRTMLVRALVVPGATSIFADDEGMTARGAMVRAFVPPSASSIVVHGEGVVRQSVDITTARARSP